jgi:hypothetical protein
MYANPEQHARAVGNVSEAMYQTGADHGANKLRDRSPVEVSATQVQSAAKEVHGWIDQLTQRLQPVLMPDGPTGAGAIGGGAPTPLTCPLVHQLDNASGELRSAAMRIEALLQRLAT